MLPYARELIYTIFKSACRQPGMSIIKLWEMHAMPGDDQYSHNNLMGLWSVLSLMRQL